MSLLLLFRGAAAAGNALAGATGVTLTTAATRLTEAQPLAGATTATLTSAATMAGGTQPIAGSTALALTAGATTLTVGHALAGATTLTLTAASGGFSATHALAGATTVTLTPAARIRLTADATGVYQFKVGHWTAGAWVVDATLSRANLGYVEQVLNEPWSAEFSMHTLDPEAYTYLRPAYLGGVREVQIWRDGRCIFWGVPLQARANLATVTFSCAGLLWYYGRRFFGPIQNNYLTNPDFESGTTGWTGVNTTATPSSTWRALGTQSIKLVQTTAGQDGYLRQRYTTTTTTQAVYFVVKALCHVVDTGWVGPALQERGLYLEQQVTPGGAAVDGAAVPETPYGPKWEPINEKTQRNHSKPIRLETGIFIPAGVTRTIEVRLYSPGGTVYWDATSLSVEESVGSAVTGDAANVIITRVNTYAQNAAQGKSDLNIGIDGAPGTYPSLVRIYQAFDNANIWDALSEYPAIAACDLEATWDPYTATTRALKMFPPTKGTFKAGSPVTLGTNMVEDFGYDVNAGAIVTAARVLGQGEGADREIGYATDTSQVGGLVLESVASASVDSPIDSLQSQAATLLAASRSAVFVPEFRLPGDAVFGAIEVGDTVPVVADYGYVQEPTVTRRIVRLRLEANDSVLVGVNS